jgi:hypothetical protein
MSKQPNEKSDLSPNKAQRPTSHRAATPSDLRESPSSSNTEYRIDLDQQTTQDLNALRVDLRRIQMQVRNTSVPHPDPAHTDTSAASMIQADSTIRDTSDASLSDLDKKPAARRYDNNHVAPHADGEDYDQDTGVESAPVDEVDSDIADYFSGVDRQTNASSLPLFYQEEDLIASYEVTATMPHVEVTNDWAADRQMVAPFPRPRQGEGPTNNLECQRAANLTLRRLSEEIQAQEVQENSERLKRQLKRQKKFDKNDEYNQITKEVEEGLKQNILPRPIRTAAVPSTKVHTFQKRKLKNRPSGMKYKKGGKEKGDRSTGKGKGGRPTKSTGVSNHYDKSRYSFVDPHVES